MILSLLSAILSSGFSYEDLYQFIIRVTYPAHLNFVVLMMFAEKNVYFLRDTKFHTHFIECFNVHGFR